ncbi:MAG: CAP domain-containing protein [Acidobacteriota bacterium]
MGAARQITRLSVTAMILRKIVLVPVLAILAAPALAAFAEEPDPLLKGSEITVGSVLEQINFYRGLHRLMPLRLDDRLSLAAADRIADMEENTYWGHISPRGVQPFVWIAPHGYRFIAAGENLACGFDTPQVMVGSWMESPGHRANILSPIFQDIGIAIIEGSTMGRASGRSVVTMFGSEAPGHTAHISSATTKSDH